MLTGENTYLRRLEKIDLERSLKWINDPSIMVIMGVWGPRTAYHQERWYEEIAVSKTNLVFALCLKESDEHIGNLSLFDIDYINRNAGLTIFIADEGHRGGGVGTEAVRLLVEYAFDYLNLHRVYCRTNNEIAAKLYERIGFVKEGVSRQSSYEFGQYMDKVLYGLLKNDYEKK